MINEEFLDQLVADLERLHTMCARRGASRSILANIKDVEKSIAWLKTQQR